MDTLTPARRSENMRRIRSKDSSPEMAVRRIVHGLGYRYRLHAQDLPGKPDLVFRRLKKVIFVHGCFWHSHRNCGEAHVPKSRQEYWMPKLERNKQRDAANKRALTRLGWRYMIVWECEVRKPDSVVRILQAFLEK